MNWIELTERTFKFTSYAKFWFAHADHVGKTVILRALGSDFILKDGKISICLAKPYEIIQNGIKKINTENAMLELTDFTLDKAKTGVFAPVFDTVSG